jgi:hypothetical protein
MFAGELSSAEDTTQPTMIDSLIIRSSQFTPVEDMTNRLILPWYLNKSLKENIV